MKIEKILWPTDLSENAAHALPYVTSLAQQYQAEIHILYVLKEYVEFGAAYGDTSPQEDYERMRKWERETAEKRLDELCEKYLNACPLYIRHIDTGDPAQKILDLIHKEGADLVIMASRGRESHFDFGSVAERVLRCTDIPVLTVPA
ncbi:MAG TPA: universal stress protein [Desulfosalsimonadaceae bacterium]|nr:universal stress protein [Desulfosalsimonadaceae bacterium]